MRVVSNKYFPPRTLPLRLVSPPASAVPIRLLSQSACHLRRSRRPRLVPPACRIITVGRRPAVVWSGARASYGARVPTPVLCRLCLRRECVPAPLRIIYYRASCLCLLIVLYSRAIYRACVYNN
ncbi:hypothetical protein K523DRAFT_415839 [Schizophyllum commune Tattone D]|nr:hypothetical protein K523DRAFT_415839 [Schizophyllum commune Tattone D]